MALWTYLAVACLLTGPSISSRQQHATDEAQRATLSPKWRVNLLPVIGGVPLGKTYGRQREYKALPQTSFWFLNNKKIVATFITREENSSLLARGNSNSNSADRLRPVFIDSDTGKVTDVEDWPATSMNAGIIAVHNGMFVVQVGNELTLYSGDTKLLKHLTLPALESGEWWAHPSPSGKNILFVPPDHTTGLWLWVDTDTLQVTHSWQDTETGDLAISDDTLAMVTCTWRFDCPRTISVRGFDTGWHGIAPGHVQSCPQFVDDSRLFLSGPPSTLMRTDGSVVFTDSVFKPCWMPKVYPAPASHRFVAPSCSVEGAIGILDVGGHAVLRRILVHDDADSSGGWSYLLAVKGPAIKGLTQFAISPDGQRFALLNNGSVEFFGLPRSRN